MQLDEPSPDIRRALAILARDPNNVSANIQAGVYYSQEDALDKSAYHLKKALGRGKKNPLVLEKLVDVYLRQHLYKEAKVQARKLVNVDKRSPAALHMMARTYEGLADFAKAIHWIDLALERDPKNIRILSDKAKYHSIAGEIAKSIEIHREILKIDPLTPNSWWPIAQLQKYTAEEARSILANINAALEASAKDDEKRGLHFASGKILQDIDEHGQAFEHFEKANLLHECEIMADKIIATNINLRETYSSEFFENRSDFGNTKHRPIFILGQTRSGTTLTESICASHSQISAGGELANIFDYGKEMEIHSIAENTHRNNIHGLSQADVTALANDYISGTKHLQKECSRLTDKLPHNFLHIGMIALLFPNAKIIHCRRHPMDNCLSIFSNPMVDYHKEYKSELDVLGEYYRNYTQIMDFWQEVCPIEIHDVYYEDLVTNTENVARGMIEYLGLDWEDNVLDRSQSKQAVKTLSVWQVRQPVFQSSKGKWRNYEKQLQPVREALGSCVKDYEKELANLDVAEANAK